ncbi:MAG: hypothetical protein QME50_04455 [Candidatus Bathyarchaeota archaeon]|nr:hypothetical protein [Candidatus Bathyarchaeota archaeon]MDI6805686.1 hypothetical protein [Candidatus Bathyarchaeia archaeon]
MDSVDKVIWVSPFLGVLDVVSTLYVESFGYSLSQYETGLLARIFINAGLTYLYIPVYLLTLIAFAYVLWFIKNRKLDSSRTFDKILFLFLVGAACYIYVRITAAFIGNFLLPYRVSGRVSESLINLLIYLSTAFTLTIYLWRDVILWVKANGNKKK